MTSIADPSVTIRVSSEPAPSPPSWFGEVTPLAHFLKRQGVLRAITKLVRFARRRFGHYEGAT